MGSLGVVARVVVVILAGLLWAGQAFAQPGFLVAAPGTGRPTCDSIANKVAAQTWCGEGATLTLKVWNGTTFISNFGVGSINGLSGAITLQGTTNQVQITPSGNTLTFALPQSIAPGNSPAWANVTLSSLAGGGNRLPILNSSGTFFTDANLVYDPATKIITPEGDTFALIDPVQLGGLRLGIAAGTSSVPTTLKGGAFQVFKTSTLTSAGCANKADPQCSAAVTIEHRSIGTGNDQQIVGLNVEAKNTGTAASGEGRDTAAIHAVGISTKGQATGGFFQGRIDVPGTLTDARTAGIEVQSLNAGGADCPADDDGGGCQALRVVSHSTGATTNRSGAGVLLRSTGGSNTAERSFIYGFFCTNNAAETSCFEDVSAAGTSYRIRNTHEYGIDARAATFGTAAIRLSSGTNEARGLIQWDDGAGTISLKIQGNTPSIYPGVNDTGSLGIFGKIFNTIRVNNVFAASLAAPASTFECVHADDQGQLFLTGSDCGSGGGGGGISTIGGQGGPNITLTNDTNVTLSGSGNALIAGWTGTLAASRGGLGMTIPADDTLPISNGTVWQAKTIPDCQDSGGQHLNYTASSNTLSCGTSGGGGGSIGGTIAAGQLGFGTATDTLGGSNNLKWDNANGFLQVGAGTPGSAIHVFSSDTSGNTPAVTLENTAGATPGAFGPALALKNGVAATHGFVVTQMQSATSEFCIADAASPFTQYLCISQAGVTSLSTPLPATSGGTGLASGTSGGVPYFSSSTTIASSAALTNHGMVVGGGAGAAPRSLTALTNGQLYIGSTGADPVPSSLTSSTASFTPGAGSLTLDVTGILGGTIDRVPFWTSATAIGNSDGLKFNPGTSRLTVGGGTNPGFVVAVTTSTTLGDGLHLQGTSGNTRPCVTLKSTGAPTDRSWSVCTRGESAGALAFLDNNAGQERARFDTAGNFGVGGTPTSKLHVFDGGANVTRNDGNYQYLLTRTSAPAHVYGLAVDGGQGTMAIDDVTNAARLVTLWPAVPTSATPTVSIARTETLSVDTSGAQNAALDVLSTGTNVSGGPIVAQPVAIRARAIQLGSGDAVGVFSAVTQSGSGGYAAFGAYHQANTTTATGAAIAINTDTRNAGGVADAYVYGTSFPRLIGLDVTYFASSGTGGAALLTRAADAAQWRTGISFWPGSITTNLIEAQNFTVAVSGDTRHQKTIVPATSDASSVMHVYDASALGAGQGGRISFGGVYTSGGALWDWAAIGAPKDDATSGNNTGSLAFYTRAQSGATWGAPRMQVTSGGGVVVGAATGGSQGAGTLNAQGLFVNGVTVGTGGNLSGTLTAGRVPIASSSSTLVDMAAFTADTTNSGVTITRNTVNAVNPQRITGTIGGDRTNKGSIHLPQLYGPGIDEISYVAGLGITVSDATNVLGTLTTAGVNPGDTTVAVISTAGFAASGTAFLDLTDNFTYTGVTGTSFTGVSGISSVHASGAPVSSSSSADGFSSHAMIVEHNLSAGFTGFGIGLSSYMTTSRNTQLLNPEQNDTYGFLSAVRDNNAAGLDYNVVGYYGALTVDSSTGGGKVPFGSVLSNHTNVQANRFGYTAAVGDVTDAGAGNVNFTADAAYAVFAVANSPASPGLSAWTYAFDIKNADGSSRAHWTNSGIVRAASNTSGAPGLSFSGDTNTGINGDADTLSFVTGGTDRVIVGSAGDLVITKFAAGGSTLVCMDNTGQLFRATGTTCP